MPAVALCGIRFREFNVIEIALADERAVVVPGENGRHFAVALCGIRFREFNVIEIALADERAVVVPGENGRHFASQAGSH